MNRIFSRASAWFARNQARRAALASRAEQLDSGIGADAPIRTASQDRLRRTDFAERIAGVLSELTLREGRVFAIRGAWGFGKSSLKNLITEKLDTRQKGADWVDFNPWQWGDGDAIARALFSQIADRLGGDHSQAARSRAETLRRYGEMLTGAGSSLKESDGSSKLISSLLTNTSVVVVASAIGFDLPIAAQVAAGLATLAIVAPLIGRVLLYLGRHHRESEPLNKVRSALESQLRELDRPLVVFVDDIDRLEPEQIRTLLRQVKANANLPNIVFVLLFQPSIVESALDPVANGDGRAFLEKIVQTSFDLPAVSASVVHAVFAEELFKLAEPYANEANGVSQQRWGNAFVGCIQPRLRNMRDARRLISSIAVHLPLHVAGDVFEVNLIDFLLLETLRVFEPDLHSALFRERSLVLQERRFGGDRRDDENKAAAELLIGIVSELRRDISRDTLKNLFPTLEWAYGGTRYAEGFYPKWLASKRACTGRYFPRYFELQTAEGEISDSRFIAFIEAAATEEGLAAAISGAEVDGLLDSLVERLDESAADLPVVNASVLLPGMFQIAQRFAGASNVGMFGSPWISGWRAVSWYIKRIPEDVRGEHVIAALRKTEALSVAAMMINLNDPAARNEDDADQFEPTLDLPTIEALKHDWLALIRRRAQPVETLISEPDLVSLLYRWRDYAGSLDEPRAWMEQAISTDAGFANIVTRLVGTVTTHADGDLTYTTHKRFNKETIADFIGIDAARLRCDAIDLSAFPENRADLETLKVSIERWLGLRERDAFDI
ncbi:P-loop NTPase fold protein [Duganella violaceipulchra]|uniref:KAP family NTPase n=1 Tax=Duganella violaceipulchra TaxID=2849652 RepID=A0AA41L6S4_9BURK|nr:P-loop NTPase fold protein [Duganella violaceicalia]MBV6325569.1 KAP family NTPase [Duganella violaceicalia]